MVSLLIIHHLGSSLVGTIQILDMSAKVFYCYLSSEVINFLLLCDTYGGLRLRIDSSWKLITTTINRLCKQSLIKTVSLIDLLILMTNDQRANLIVFFSYNKYKYRRSLMALVWSSKSSLLQYVKLAKVCIN